MNRVEFMNELNILLQSTSNEERESALQYYNDYFDDAGVENESQVISELGSPQKVSAIIKAGIQGKDDESSEYSETGYTDTRFEQKHDLVRQDDVIDQDDGIDQGGSIINGESYQKQNNSSRYIALIILAIICLPIVIPVVLGGIATVISLVFALIASIFSLLIAAFGIAVSGIIMIAAGITELTSFTALGIGLIGAGMIVLAIGTVLTALMGHVVFKVTPILFNGVVNVCQRIFNRRKVRSS